MWFQKIINKIYRYPKAKWETIIRYGGAISYYRMVQNKKNMIAASLHLPPMQCDVNGLPLYFLTGTKYLYQTLFCIKSLYSVSSEKYCIYLIDDGSFDSILINRINKQLPGAITVKRESLDQLIEQLLPINNFPILHRKRKEYIHIRKLIDIHLLQDGRDYKIVLDSDMLFFKNPKDLIEWLKTPDGPIYMIDCYESYGYSISKMAEIISKPIPNLVNVGIIGLKSSDINWQELEQWIKILEEENGKSYFLEQALSAMLIGDKNSKILEREKYVVNPTHIEITEEIGTLHHYVDLSKKGYFNIAWKKIAH